MNKSSVLSFESREYLDRLSRVQAGLRSIGVECAVVCSPENIYYLSGYMTRAITSPQFLLVPDNGKPLLVVRDRDIANLHAIAGTTPIETHATYLDDEGAPAAADVLVATLRQHFPRLKSIGFEENSYYCPLVSYRRILNEYPHLNSSDISGVLEEPRLFKSAAEIECHRAAGKISAVALRAGVEAARAGNTDSHVAAQIAATQIEAGSEWVSTWPVVLTGQNTGRAHSSWQHVTIQKGSPTTIEFASAVARYHTPLYTTVIDNPTQEHRKLVAVLNEALEVVLDVMRPGAVSGEIFAKAEDVIAKAGYADMIRGRIGYTVGIGFPPNWVQRLGVDIARNGTRVLRPSMVFHMVMILRNQNKLGVGRSHSVLITETGRELLGGDIQITEPILRP